MKRPLLIFPSLITAAEAFLTYIHLKLPVMSSASETSLREAHRPKADIRLWKDRHALTRIRFAEGFLASSE